MNIKSFQTFVFQVNLVDAYSFLDNRGKVFSKALNFGENKLIENGDTLRVSDDKADYSLSSATFIMRIKPDKLQTFIDENKKTELVSYVNSLNKEYIEKTKEICNLLQIEKISRFACRFITNYKDSKDKEIEDIFGITKSILNKDLRSVEKTISTNGANLRCSYNGTDLVLDIDKYINSKHFDIKEIDDKYNKVLQNFRENIFVVKNLIKESI